MATEVKYTKHAITLDIISPAAAPNMAAASAKYPAFSIVAKNSNTAASYLVTPAFYSVKTVDQAVEKAVADGGDAELARAEALVKWEQTKLYAMVTDKQAFDTYQAHLNEAADLQALLEKAEAEENVRDIEETAAMLAAIRESNTAERLALPVVLSVESVIMGRANKGGFFDHYDQIKAGSPKSQVKTATYCGINGRAYTDLYLMLNTKTTVAHLEKLLSDFVVTAEGTRSKRSKADTAPTVDAFLTGW